MNEENEMFIRKEMRGNSYYNKYWTFQLRKWNRLAVIAWRYEKLIEEVTSGLLYDFPDLI